MGERADVTGTLTLTINTSSLAQLLGATTSDRSRAELIDTLIGSAADTFIECGDDVAADDDGSTITLTIDGDYLSSHATAWMRRLAAAGAVGTITARDWSGEWRWVLAQGRIDEQSPTLVYPALRSATDQSQPFWWKPADITEHPTLLAVVEGSTNSAVAWTFDESVADRIIAVLCADADDRSAASNHEI
jgi:hypothetical protein